MTVLDQRARSPSVSGAADEEEDTKSIQRRLKKLTKKLLKKSDQREVCLHALAREFAGSSHKEPPFVWTVDQLSKHLSRSRKFQICSKNLKVRLASKDKTSSFSSSSSLVGTSKKGTSTVTTATDSSDSSTANTLDAVSWRKKNKVVVVQEPTEDGASHLSAASTLVPYQTFDDDACQRHINPALLRKCTADGFAAPSPIQAQAWPILLSGRNLVGIAETGSGKTLGFGLPALHRLTTTTQGGGHATANAKRPRPPRMLVLSPTRELAMQSHAVLHDYGEAVGIISSVLYGGVPKPPQIDALRKGNIDAVVATPGRLKDLMQMPRSPIRLDHVEYLVLDEADRMLDLGFERDVKYIVGECTHNTRQTCMFSATWPASIQALAASFFVTPPVRVYVGFDTITKDRSTSDNGTTSNNNNNNDGDSSSSAAPTLDEVVVVDDALSANKRVQQIIEVLDDAKRDARLRAILQQTLQSYKQASKPTPRILVFALYKKEAERLESRLQRDGYTCTSIHGNKAQAARTLALEQFKDGSVPLLVATDVAARGLHIPDVQVVINYTFPLTIEDYVHRIGRTGRAGQSGVAYTFFQPTDKLRAGELQQVLRQSGQPIPDALLQFGSTIKRKEHKLYGNFGPSNDGRPAKKATKITFNYSDDENDE